VSDELYQPREFFALVDMQVTCGKSGMPTATMHLRTQDGESLVDAAVGVGPVDATFKAIDKLVSWKFDIEFTLLEYAVHAVTEGIDALGEVTVRVETNEDEPRTFGGHGADLDVIVASAKAYISAINRMMAARGTTTREVTAALELHSV
jgi:2-isopropylmalate synthase